MGEVVVVGLKRNGKLDAKLLRCRRAALRERRRIQVAARGFRLSRAVRSESGGADRIETGRIVTNPPGDKARSEKWIFEFSEPGAVCWPVAGQPGSFRYQIY